MPKLGFELRTFETEGHCLPRDRITINLAAHSLKSLIIYKERKTDGENNRKKEKWRERKNREMEKMTERERERGSERG